jgi:bifunctional DNase/RNase
MKQRIEIQGLIIDPITNMPVVLLSLTGQGTFIPLWVGLYEANGMALEMEGIATPRPMTHDLFKNTIQAMGGTVARVELSAFRENTFFATVFIELKGKEVAIDARPSDAFSLAIRFRAPIYVAQSVLDKVETFRDIDTWQRKNEPDEVE